MKTCTGCLIKKPEEEFDLIKSKPGKRLPRCKQCTKKYRKKHYDENRERLLQHKRDYYQQHKDVFVKRNRANYEKDRKSYIEYSAQWRRDNPERAKQQQRNWKAANWERKKELDHRRRARKQDNGAYVVIPKDLRKLSGPCVYCGSVEKITMDHVIPISRGGTHGIGNLVPCCLKCNTIKGMRTIMEWRCSISWKRT